MIGVRDNFLRWAAGGTEMAPVLAIAAVLLAGSATMLLYFFVEGWGQCRVARLRRVVLPSLPIGILTGIASVIILEALDRGRVTVVAPLTATQALWVVALSALLMQRVEAVGWQLAFAAILVAIGCADRGKSVVRHADLGSVMPRQTGRRRARTRPSDKAAVSDIESTDADNMAR